ncbi:MAG: SagB/ThcOx family dehydrogenase [Euryarchaeota archaeon]|nr:SagB/ThcOx family dehydrogenase [Euryarchaeota archaeon]
MLKIPICTVLVLIPVLITGACIEEGETEQNTRQEDEIMLPEPRTTGEISIEEAMRNRRSVRQYTEEGITLNDLSQLLWAAQGISSEEGFRTAPSAGALYPLEVYVVAGKVDGLSDGVYRYRTEGHTLQRICDGDLRENLSECALNQTQVTDAAADIVFAAAFNRTTAKYGERGARYVYIEAGHAAQNVYLQAEAFGLGVCAVGAFYEQEVSELLALSRDETPIYILTVGKV